MSAMRLSAAPGLVFTPPVWRGWLPPRSKRRAVKITGAGITIAVGLIATVFTIGEAATKTAAVPPGAHLGALIGTALSLAVVVTGISFVRSAR